MHAVIIIPARYGSTRFPGKPLAKLGGHTMLAHVVKQARIAAQSFEECDILVATDHERIFRHAQIDLDVPVVITPESCATGTDRALAALQQLVEWPDFIVNLQGDAPFTPPKAISALIKSFEKDRSEEILTPVQKLTWDELDRMRESKKTTPRSGTTVIMDADHHAIWFSKAIIPVLQNEEDMRASGSLSPIWRHLGLYGYRADTLEKFATYHPSKYEQLEGLEQLRMLENGLRVTCVPVDFPQGALLSGIDTPEDLKRAEALLKAERQKKGLK